GRKPTHGSCDQRRIGRTDQTRTTGPPRILYYVQTSGNTVAFNRLPRMKLPDAIAAFNLAGQTALITGGGTGLGFGMASCLVAAGAKVVLVGRRAKELEDASASLGKNAFALPGDITRLETAPSIVDQAEQLAGPVTLLVNNAGVHLKKPA